MDEDDRQNEQLIQYLEKIETSAEDIIADNELIVKLDEKRNNLREAIRGLQNPKVQSNLKNSWLFMGDMFVKVSKENALAYLKQEQKAAEEEINNKRNNLKVKLNKLRDLEGKPHINPGFDLNPLTQSDLSFLGL